MDLDSSWIGNAKEIVNAKQLRMAGDVRGDKQLAPFLPSSQGILL